uniref:Ribosomal protein S13 n=1 Tax=Reclinomonas americana TaxID=48483 RepID=O21258_RECAM|nr:ribosomal protein S13 [Reclinomonas americana]AAD11885.1 ribosomal protein S13 [Reclinomonas americana]
MIHLFGININSNKKIPFALKAIYGLGNKKVDELCSYMGLNPKLKMSDLNESQISKLCHYIEENFLIESELRKNQTYNIKRLLDIKSYRGLRHAYGLPVHGQRTHTNAKTQKSLSKRRNIKAL